MMPSEPSILEYQRSERARAERLRAIIKDKPIKAITLWQPWASLMALGEKRIETRSWPTRYRGPLAIHASKHTPRLEIGWAQTVPAFRNALAAHGLTFGDLPRSRVLCVVDLVGCFPVSELHKAEFVLGRALDANELAFGNYSAGRFAWVTRLIGLVDDPGPTQGKQGMWEWLRGPKTEATRQAIAERAYARWETSL